MSKTPRARSLLLVLACAVVISVLLLVGSRALKLQRTKSKNPSRSIHQLAQTTELVEALSRILESGELSQLEALLPKPGDLRRYLDSTSSTPFVPVELARDEEEMWRRFEIGGGLDLDQTYARMRKSLERHTELFLKRCAGRGIRTGQAKVAHVTYMPRLFDDEKVVPLDTKTLWGWLIFHLEQDGKTCGVRFAVFEGSKIDSEFFFDDMTVGERGLLQVLGRWLQGEPVGSWLKGREEKPWEPGEALAVIVKHQLVKSELLYWLPDPSREDYPRRAWLYQAVRPAGEGPHKVEIRFDAGGQASAVYLDGKLVAGAKSEMRRGTRTGSNG